MGTVGRSGCGKRAARGVRGGRRSGAILSTAEEQGRQIRQRTGNRAAGQRAIRVLLVDDHYVVRQGLRACLAEQKDIEIVGEAEDGRQALAAVRKWLPDVVVLDVLMPGMDGLEVAAQISSIAPEQVRVVILSMCQDTQTVRRAFAAGARGYVTKSASVEELVRAVRTVFDGQKYLSASLGRMMVERLIRPCTAAAGGPRLTERERQVVRLLAEGHSAREIGFALGISSKTVHSFRQRIMGKLGLRSLAELTKYAIRQGLTGLGNGPFPGSWSSGVAGG